MFSLREKLLESQAFLTGVELVSVRGTMATKSAVKARQFARDLVEEPRIDWVSITDNAGGNPQLAPQSLGKPILYAGKEVVIHLTCKDLNRNGLESEAWSLHSEGFRNILAMTGDYPIAGNDGLAKPVFDIDSVGLIAMLHKMNRGFDHAELINPNYEPKYEKTQFLIGAVTTNFKLLEGELIPQYLKLQKKVQAGARFIINQIGYDSRKMHELRGYMDTKGMGATPLIGNVYLLNARVAKLFNAKKIPGVVVSDELLQICQRRAESKDKGKSFFQEFAARQVAIYRGLGYRGAYLGGVHEANSVRNILAIADSFSNDDWKGLSQEILYSRPMEYFYFEKNPVTQLAALDKPSPPQPSGKASVHYRLSKWMHDHVFDPETRFAKFGAQACKKAKDPMQGPASFRFVESVSKNWLYRCKDCGDCSLPDIAYLCPESQCAKNQRNGPCGGTRDGRCEVDGYGDCIWLRAHERLKVSGNSESLLTHSPMVQNQGLRGTSAWANHWLHRDHQNR